MKEPRKVEKGMKIKGFRTRKGEERKFRENKKFKENLEQEGKQEDGRSTKRGK